ncbi:MAG: sporulation initiation factor Spo0A C-terminal domain-containing protein [Treponema sp.]|nr:sporulation initiation factor Spo0A C-terminal domain-containing protein [Treponema sp.]
MSQEIYINNLLKELGCPICSKGFNMLKSAILKVLENKDLTNFITKNLYIEIAKEFGISYYSAERCMRYCIEGAFYKTRTKKLFELFENQIDYKKDKATTKEFILIVVNYIETNNLSNKG